MKIVNMLVAIMLLNAVTAAAAEPLTKVDYTGVVHGPIVDAAPDGRWFVVAVTRTEPERAELAGKQLRMRVGWGPGPDGKSRPLPEELAVVQKWLEAGEPVAVAVEPKARDMLARVKADPERAATMAERGALLQTRAIRADITGEVVSADEGGRFAVVRVQRTDPGEGYDDLIGRDLRVMTRYGGAGPRDYHVEVLRGWNAGDVVTFNADGTAGDLRLNVPPKDKAQKESIRAMNLAEGNVSRPPNALDDDRPARQVEPERITGGDVDETKVDVVLKVSPADAAKPADGQTTFDDIDAAAARAVELMKQGKGVKLLLAPATYRPTDTLDFDARGNTEAHKRMSDATLVIEGDGGQAVISGSVTEGFEPEKWELVDAERKVYRIDWEHDWPFIDRGYYSIPHVEMHGRELLAINGMPALKTQLEGYTYVDGQGRVYDMVGNLVGREAGLEGGYTYTGFRGLEHLPPGRFAVNKLGPGDADYDGHPYPDSLLLRLPEGVSDINDLKIEVGMVGHLIRLRDKSNVVLRNVTFEHSAAYANGPPGAALETNGWGDWDAPYGNWLIENCEFSRNGNEGLTIFWVRGITARNVIVKDNGGRGAFLQHVQNVLAEDWEVTGNNRMGGEYGFVKHSVGGIDWRGQEAIFRRVNCNENIGTGFRGDVVASNLIFEDCQFNRNIGTEHRDGNGMFHEISFGPILITNCQFVGNEGDGFFMLNVHDVVIENSRFEDNQGAAISMMAQPSRTTDADMNAPGVEQQPGAIAITRNLNTVLRDSVLVGRGPEGYLIERTTGAGNPSLYVTWYTESYTGENNTFWNPDTPDVFNITGRWEPRVFTDLTGWREATGEDGSSLWQAPAVSGSSPR